MLNFAKISKDGPGVAHHAVEAFDDKVPSPSHHSRVRKAEIFVHGGTKFMGGQPCRDLWKFYAQKGKWVLENNKGPKLAHHCACSADDKLFITVGGFDGKSRLGDVWLYDYRAGEWMQAETEGFPRGAGLTGHTLQQTANPDEFVVIGRLGGIRQQRQASSVLKLTRDSENGFLFEELEASPQSRSGHSATAISSTEVTLIGGRAGDSGGGTDGETVKPGLKLKPSQAASESEAGSRKERTKSRSRRNSNTSGRTSRGSKSKSPPRAHSGHRRRSSSSPPPNGGRFSRFVNRNGGNGKKGRCPPRKNHIAVPDGKGGIFVHGGEAMAPMDTPYGDIWLYRKGDFYELKADPGIPALCGHKCVTVDDVVMCFGGLGDDFMVTTDVYTLTIKD